MQHSLKGRCGPGIAAALLLGAAEALREAIEFAPRTTRSPMPA